MFTVVIREIQGNLRKISLKNVKFPIYGKWLSEGSTNQQLTGFCSVNCANCS